MGNNEEYFRGCLNLNLTATDAPDLTGTTTLHQIFEDCTSFNGDIGHWDVSKVIRMSYMFNDAEAFNRDISSWDVSKVTSMFGMFASTDMFNQDISGWDVDQVTSCQFFKSGSALSEANTPNFTMCSP